MWGLLGILSRGKERARQGSEVPNPRQKGTRIGGIREKGEEEVVGRAPEID